MFYLAFCFSVLTTERLAAAMAEANGEAIHSSLSGRSNVMVQEDIDVAGLTLTWNFDLLFVSCFPPTVDVVAFFASKPELQRWRDNFCQNQKMLTWVFRGEIKN